MTMKLITTQTVVCPHCEGVNRIEFDITDNGTSKPRLFQCRDCFGYIAARVVNSSNVQAQALYFSVPDDTPISQVTA